MCWENGHGKGTIVKQKIFHQSMNVHDCRGSTLTCIEIFYPTPPPLSSIWTSVVTPHSFHTRTLFTASKPLFFVAERLNLVAAIKSLRQTHFFYVSRFGEAKLARIGVRVYRMSRMTMRAHPHAPVGTSTSFIAYSTYSIHTLLENTPAGQATHFERQNRNITMHCVCALGWYYTFQFTLY